MRILATLFAFSLLAACASGALPSEQASPIPPGFDLVAKRREAVVIPEDERGYYHVVTPGTAYSVALDKQMRIAAIYLDDAPPSPPVSHPEGDPNRETLDKAHGPASLKSLPDRIEFTLWSNKRDGTVLMIRNGERKPIIYYAALIHGVAVPENFELTTICAVGGGKINFEHWYEQVDGIAILKVLDPPPSDTTICIDPTGNYEKPRWYTIDE